MDEFFQANWEQLQEPIKRRWTKFTDEDLKEIAGNYDALVAVLQLHYGYTQERAQQQVQELANDFALQPSSAPRP